MLSLLILSALFGCSAAQVFTQCECGLFNVDQFNTSLTASPIPLDYEANPGVAPTSNCGRDPALSNDCMIYCQSFYDGADSVDLCTGTGSSSRCTGSQWCESLYNNGIKDITNGVISLYYRMSECEGTAFTEWNYGWREIRDEGLCCNNGQYNNCDTPCETCVSSNLCECGIFAEAQFDADRLGGANPLPLVNIGAEFGSGSDFYCNSWPGPEFGHPCDAYCINSANTFKSNVSLNAVSNKNPSVTYGQFFCQALKTRWADQWPDFGIGPTTLRAHARMPGCNVDEANNHLRWKTSRTYGCHHEELCCDGSGNRYPCPVVEPLF